MFKRLLALLALLVTLPFSASATGITYTYSGTASGSLGATAFSNAEFVITALADTDNIGPWCCSDLHNTHSTASISIGGLGTSVFLDATHTWMAEGCCMGFGFNDDNNLITLFTPAVADVGYTLDTAFSPVTDDTASTQGQFTNVGTTGGSLTISSLGPVTFQASLVPEPSAYALMMVGLLGVAAAARRRR